MSSAETIREIQKLKQEIEEKDEYIKMLQGKMSDRIADAHPLVLFFASLKDKEEFAEIIRQAHPNLISRKL